jgi:Arc/MetJ-type ribon-helix-helix transcriptional regulator
LESAQQAAAKKNLGRPIFVSQSRSTAKVGHQVGAVADRVFIELDICLLVVKIEASDLVFLIAQESIVSLTLPADIHQRVQAQLASGMFTSVDDVIRQAMDTLEKRQTALGSLQKMVSVADDEIQAGKSGLFDNEKTKATVRQRLNQVGIVE